MDTAPHASSRVDACIEWLRARIDRRVFPGGARVPSIRALARTLAVSPFTAAEAYERMAAAGLIAARRGAGYYVCEVAAPVPNLARASAQVDLKWLMQQMLDSGRAASGPGLGVLPAAWLDGDALGATLRAIGREGPGRLLEGGTAQGYAPLREVLARRLAAFGIAAHAEQIVLTTGITHAIHLVLQTLVMPGDTVLVLDPSWFGALGMLALRGARVIGVPYAAGGPDLAALDAIARETRPRLLLINSVVQNPTGLALDAAAVARIVQIAARYDFHVIEDDVYADLCDPLLPRLAAYDGLQRVIYAGGYSKTLAANLRVGYLACSENLARTFADTKVLTGYTTPEVNERALHKLLANGRYGRHVAALRERLDLQRRKALRLLEREGFAVYGRPAHGLFAWVDMACDTNELALRGRERGLLLAPGSLFSPTQRASRFMRYNVTTAADAALRELFAAARQLAHD
ncbi:GntR family transcriptional regulator [Tahibacter aquaticus]|uniref:GntR family transcriptional regulator n=1 Tax=Tahibacter aquaticus TaxID=520092 RepID=A0A4R6YL99_9GAMM|nr:PLP-dependent aminotransferase family protein [Tahibacter aquaticus]TDR37843.1 GntR family transcriptional regulator [Tahibacter aquaticus]